MFQVIFVYEVNAGGSKPSPVISPRLPLLGPLGAAVVEEVEDVGVVEDVNDSVVDDIVEDSPGERSELVIGLDVGEAVEDGLAVFVSDEELSEEIDAATELP